MSDSAAADGPIRPTDPVTGLPSVPPVGASPGLPPVPPVDAGSGLPAIPPPPSNLTPQGPLTPEPLLPAPPINARPAVPEPAPSDSAPIPPTPERQEFVPLRTDPPPELAPTWWVRYALFATMIGAIAAVLETERRGEPGDVVGSPLVIGLHVAVGVLVVIWSSLAMANAERLVPATRYQTPARGWLAAILWVAAFLTPAIAVLVTRDLRSTVVDSEELAPTFSMAAIVLIAVLVVWAPFRYHVLHGRRIGAPRNRLAMWFWAPVMATVGGVTIVGLGLRDDFAEDGITATERVVLVGVVYGLGALVLTLATWRATTVFDEVIEIRWRRWKNEWEQTLAEMSAQPPPRPEIGAPHE